MSKTKPAPFRDAVLYLIITIILLGGVQYLLEMFVGDVNFRLASDILSSFVIVGATSFLLYLRLREYDFSIKNYDTTLNNFEHQQKVLLNAVSDAVVTIDTGNRIVFVNKNVRKLCGYPDNELLGEELFLVIPDEYKKYYYDLIQNYISTGIKTINWSGMETVLKHKKGHTVPIELSITEFEEQGQTFFTCVLKDISLRKKEEEILFTSEQRHKKILENSSESYILSNLDGIIDYASPNVHKILGYTPAELEDMNSFDLYHKDDLPKINAMWRRMRTEEMGNISGVFRLRHKTNGYRWIELNLNNLLLEEDVEAVVFNFRDISAFKGIRDELENFYNLSPEIFCSAKFDGTILNINPSAKSIFNFEPEQVIGRNIQEFIYPEDRELCTRQLKNMKLNKSASQFEIRCISGKGYKWLICTATPVPEEEIFYAVGLEITESKNAAEKFRKSEERLRAASEGGFDAFLTLDYVKNEKGQLKGFVVTYANKNAISMLGLKEENLLTLTLKDIDMLNQDQSFLDDCNLVAKTHIPLQGEHEFVTESGGYIWIQKQVVSLQNGIAITLHDITDKKHAEEMALENSEKYQLLFESNPLPMWVYDATTYYFLAVNEAAINHYGYTWEEFMHMTPLDIRPPEDVDAFKAFTDNPNKNLSQAKEWRHTRKDGSIIWAEISSRPIIFEGKNARLILANDVTARKKAEEKIKVSEERYRMLVENMMEGVLYMDNEENLVFANDQFFNMLGYDKNELKGKIFNDTILTVEGRKLVSEKNLLRQQGISDVYELQLIRKNGDPMWVLISGTPLVGQNNRIIGSLSIITDVNERKINEQKIASSEQRYRNLIETMHEGVVYIDTLHKVEFANPRFFEMLGYGEDEVIGKYLFDLVSDEEERNKLRENLMARQESISTQYEVQFTRKDGELIWVLISGNPIFDVHSEVTGAMATLTDITGLKRTEQQLKSINQDLNTFVYKSSHDLKGPLSSIMGLTALANKEISDQAALQYINMISQGATRLDNILSDLLETIRIKEGAIVLSDINFKDMIEEVLNSLDHYENYDHMVFNVNIQLKNKFYSDKKILTSVMQNLLENTIKYQDLGKEKGIVDVDISATNEIVRINVKDNGIGILESAQDKIFNMFYRANLSSKGTGLGLYIVKNAIEKLGGNIEMKSKEGVGTEFYIKLPNNTEKPRNKKQHQS